MQTEVFQATSYPLAGNFSFNKIQKVWISKKYFVTKSFFPRIPIVNNVQAKADWQNFATVLIHFEFYQQPTMQIHSLIANFVQRKVMFDIYI